MVRLTFYGGVGEIGGNKILLEDGERKLLLDFGFPFKRNKEFYEEFLKPRSGVGLLDLLTLGLLPPLEGLYRDDLVTPQLWEKFRNTLQYRKIEHIDGVLLSHAHLDHSGYISLLKSAIPVYSTAVTAFITKAIQDSGKADFDREVCYFSMREFDYPVEGWKQKACLSCDTKQQRQFCIADLNPETLSPASAKFWSWGFWEKTARQKGMLSLPLNNHSSCAFNLRCFRVDHSIPGACAWAIETGSGWIIYTGDLRLHGKRAPATLKFIEEAAKLKPKALIIEGTNVSRSSNVSEQNVYDNALKAISGCESLVIADFSARDIDRLLTFLQVARDTGRKLAVLSKDAYMLKTLRLLNSSVPDISEDANLVLYQDTSTAKAPAIWLKNLYKDYQAKVVTSEDIRKAQDKFILAFSFLDINELPSIEPAPGSLYVYSSSEPHDEEQEIDFLRLHSWLKLFNIKPFGVPVEVGNEWHVPEDEKGLHASGHACGADLLRIAREIDPEIIIPVHCEHPDFYSCLKDKKLILPTVGEAIEI